MASSSMKTDPELVRQLDAAHGTDRPVEAILKLRPPRGDVVVASGRARQITESALKRVEQEVGVSPETVNVLPNIGMVVVAADERFVRRLLDQPEFSSAVANAPDDDPTATHGLRGE